MYGTIYLNIFNLIFFFKLDDPSPATLAQKETRQQKSDGVFQFCLHRSILQSTGSGQRQVSVQFRFLLTVLLRSN